MSSMLPYRPHGEEPENAAHDDGDNEDDEEHVDETVGFC